MKTITLIALTVATLIALGVLFILSRTPATERPSDSEPFPVSDYTTNVPVISGGGTEPGGINTNQPVTENFFEVQSQTGQSIRVIDFRKSSATVEDEYTKGTYYLAGSDFSTDYTLTYIESDTSFTVTLFKEPVGEVRRKAEIDLLTKLGITEPVACFLRYVVLVPASVNAVHAGKNLGFSFCQGATQL